MYGDFQRSSPGIMERGRQKTFVSFNALSLFKSLDQEYSFQRGHLRDNGRISIRTIEVLVARKMLDFDKFPKSW